MTDKNEKALTENTDDCVDTTSLESATESSSSASSDTLTPTNTANENKDTSSSNKALPAVALLFGAVALGLSGWQYYQSQQSSSSAQALAAANNQVATLEQQVNRLTQTIENNAAAVRQIGEIDSQLNNTKLQSAQLKAQTEQALVDISSKINKLSSADRNDWLLAEAEYLIRLANQRLLLEKDTKSSLSLLSSADNILASLEDPLMFDTRKAIAQDMQALKSVASFDLEGRYLQLSALYSQVAQLPQREPSKQWQAQQEAASEAQPSSRSAIKQLLNEAWQGLKSLIVINYNHKPIKPLLPPAEYQELVTGIQIQLDVAQVALLKAEPAIYEKSLSRVAEAVNKHFDTNAQATIAFMTTLTSLQQVNPNPDVPMPRASLQAMRDLMQNWKTSTPVAQPSGTTAQGENTL